MKTKEAFKKEDIVTVETPNGVSIKAVVLHADNDGCDYYTSHIAEMGSYTTHWEYLLYAQNRIFSAYNAEDHLVWKDYDYDLDKDIEKEESTFTPLKYKEIIVDFCIIPEADDMLN